MLNVIVVARNSKISGYFLPPDPRNFVNQDHTSHTPPDPAKVKKAQEEVDLVIKYLKEKYVHDLLTKHHAPESHQYHVELE
jgi:hypothetical protein